MVPVLGKPFLEHEIELLKRSGIDDFVLCVGRFGDQVEGHFGDGSLWGVSVEYSHDGPKLLGPAGALKKAERLLEERFFVTYGDAFLRADYPSIMECLVESGKLGLMTVYHNKNAYGKSDVAVDGDLVVRYDKLGRGAGMEWINFGVSALRREALDAIPAGGFCGEEEFYGSLIERKELVAFQVKTRFYEIGTPSALEEFKRFLAAEG
jgi:N-acetyl-alpha-D-muramate 1-phosphate uridylyltransferase